MKLVRLVTEDEREKTMAFTSGNGFDLVVVSGVYIAPYAKRGWLAELEPARLDNARFLEDRWRNAYEGAARYAVPYFWGFLGIAYRHDKLPGPIDSVEAFDLMMTAARALAQSLDGELLDESGSTLSIQRERYLREEIIEFQHSNLVA